MLEYRIIRKNRKKNLTITIDLLNQIVVRANKTISRRQIDSFVQSKVEWIRKTAASNKRRNELYRPKSFIPGESFLCLGKEYLLYLSENPGSRIELDDSRLKLFLPKRFFSKSIYIKQKLVNWYRCAAYEVIFKRVRMFRQIIKVDVREIMIKELKRSWAICSSKGVLTFNWRLLMAPLDVIDYVVVHELCHRIHADHSKRFWEKVEEIMPDYKKRRGWLKTNEMSFLW